MKISVLTYQSYYNLSHYFVVNIFMQVLKAFKFYKYSPRKSPLTPLCGEAGEIEIDVTGLFRNLQPLESKLEKQEIISLILLV